MHRPEALKFIKKGENQMEENTAAAPQNTCQRFRRNEQLSPGAKNWVTKILIIIIALTLFQIPLYMVQELTAERKKQAVSVQNEIAQNWGSEQTVKLLPSAAAENIIAEVTPEIRYRGIYQTVVYMAKIKINAEYKNVSADRRGYITLSDLKGLVSVSTVINGNEAAVDKNLSFPLLPGDPKCEITLVVRGSNKLLFTPNASDSRVDISGTWASPGFIGDILPEKRTVGKEDFSAQWRSGQFDTEHNCGVNLCISAGTYQQVERCFTYATFFLIVFFFTLLAAEFITKVQVHILQYLVAAGAPVLFYLMTLAFAEKIGFTAGYALSAAVIVAMVTMYARMFLGKTIPVLIMGAVFAASYLLNFVILRMEDFALMSGTVVLTIILGVLMILTGKINRKQDIIQ